ncbi:PadR family transcriptional regulator [Companilactobacillus futsaii]|uniref:PadR family transcriptional regulator n=3 Tax=Companilactobacillus futsaii TaxID=938155 RepID=A0A5B7T5A2_9LACO|nr:regulator of phenolic acid metabolism PadR [Companilactobacillus futsaii JCM 17355]QCX25542.1 PadR family transcriptional regulator [Companilactobacillus futsaii]
MARANTLQYMILGLLTRQEMTGYDIKQTFDKEKAEFWSAPFSQIYPELSRLLKKELVELVPDETKNSRKKTYRISSQGLKLFNDWLQIPLTPGVTQLNNDDFILRLHFLGKKNQKILQPLMILRRQTIKMELIQLELELTEVVHHPEQYGREFIIRKELATKKADLKLLNSAIKKS